MNRRLISMAALMAMVLLVFSGCGKRGAAIEEEVSPDPSSPELVGTAAFGSHCPYGFYIPPQPVKTDLWDCPVALPKLELTQPPQPLVFEADCTKKTIIVRSANRIIDTSWQVMPDGSFYTSMDGGTIGVANDGAGNSNCTTRVTTELFGKLDCADRDKVKIKVESIWWLNKEPPAPTPSRSPSPSPSPSLVPSPSSTPVVVRPSATPSSSPTPVTSGAPVPAPSVRPAFFFSALAVMPSPTPSAPTCKLPASCYLHTNVVINQCP